MLAFLVSYPVTVNNFYQVNILSVFYNLLFVPYVSFILLPMTLISYLFPLLDNVLYLLIKIIELSSLFFEQICFSKVILCKMNTFFVMSYYVVLCKLFGRKNVKKRFYVFTFLTIFLFHYCMPLFNQDCVMFIDVGQGDSAIIDVNNTVTLVDTGGIVSYGDEEYKYPIVKNKTIPYLKSKGIRRIDNLVLTHGDFDHMGEAKYLVENFKVENVIFNWAAIII